MGWHSARLARCLPGCFLSLVEETPMKRLSLLALLSLAACAPSEAQIEAQWDEFLSENQSCETVDDCVIVYPGCPLGCGSAVSVGAEEEARELADSLVNRYSRLHGECMYDCMGVEAECNAGACEAVPADTGMD